MLCSSWSDCTRALFSSSLLPFHLRLAPDPCGCQGKAHGVLCASPVWRPCIVHASPLHRPCQLPSAPFFLCCPFFCFSGSHAPCVSHVHPCTSPLSPAAQHWNHPMAHGTSPTLAVVPPPHTGGPATSTRVCAQWRGVSVWGSAWSSPPEPDNGGLHEPTPDPRHTPQSSHHCLGALGTVPMLHLGPLFSSVCSLLVFFLIFLFSTFFFSAQARVPPLLPPLLLRPLLPPFPCVPCLPAWRLASLVAQAPACRRPRQSPSP